MAKGRKTGGRKREDDFTKFSRFVDLSQDPAVCWEWKGARIDKGYGRLTLWNSAEARKHTVQTHRMAWELFNGPIPKGKHVLHKCDNPACVNPKHLFLGSNMDNQTERWITGGHVQKFNLEERDEIRQFVRAGYSIGQMAKILDAHYSSIWKIVNYKRREILVPCGA